MSYIENNLIPGEQIVFRTKKHLIIFLFPAIWLLFCLFVSFYLIGNPVFAWVYWVPWLMALYFWAYVGINYLSSDFAVTNKRVMMREGFFHRHTNETRIAAISQVNVDQSLLGQLLNYGIVGINAFGAYDSFSMLARPFEFQKSVHEQLDKAQASAQNERPHR